MVSFECFRSRHFDYRHRYFHCARQNLCSLCLCGFLFALGVSCTGKEETKTQDWRKKRREEIHLFTHAKRHSEKNENTHFWDIFKIGVNKRHTNCITILMHVTIVTARYLCCNGHAACLLTFQHETSRFGFLHFHAFTHYGLMRVLKSRNQHCSLSTHTIIWFGKGLWGTTTVLRIQHVIQCCGHSFAHIRIRDVVALMRLFEICSRIEWIFNDCNIWTYKTSYLASQSSLRR